MSSEEVLPGHLYVVATPIGNLSDLSPRALKILAGVDRIAAEDTRTSGQMLSHFGLRRPMTALHEHNEDRVAGTLVAQLQQGQSIALISDAGTPLLSDPGFALVRAARQAQLPVIAVPGPSAAMAALSVAGLPTDSFVFLGFLPAKAAARRRKLEELARETRTLVFFESSHRIEDSLAGLVEVFGPERPVCLARELTKRYEQSVTRSAAEVLAWLREDENRRLGEFVLVVGGAPEAAQAQAAAEPLLKALLRELPAARAARLAVELTGMKRQDLYALALRLQGHAPPDQAPDGPGNT